MVHWYGRHYCEIEISKINIPLVRTCSPIFTRLVPSFPTWFDFLLFEKAVPKSSYWGEEDEKRVKKEESPSRAKEKGKNFPHKRIRRTDRDYTVCPLSESIILTPPSSC